MPSKIPPRSVRTPEELEPFIAAGMKRTAKTWHGYVVMAIEEKAKRETPDGSTYESVTESIKKGELTEPQPEPKKKAAAKPKPKAKTAARAVVPRFKAGKAAK